MRALRNGSPVLTRADRPGCGRRPGTAQQVQPIARFAFHLVGEAFHLVGEDVGVAALAIELGADAADIGLTIRPHPTLSETVAMAADAFEGTITDLYMARKKASR
jgi:hypothetical protein